MQNLKASIMTSGSQKLPDYFSLEEPAVEFLITAPVAYPSIS